MEKVADGVWLLRGDARKSMNIYFLEDGDGVVQFDAGTKAMVKKARAAAQQLGGLKRIVLGHAHADHRGTAPSLDAPVHCHPDEVADAESRGRRSRSLHGPLAAAGTGALDLPAAAATLGRRRGEDRRNRLGGRRGGGLSRPPLPRPRAGPDRPLARERPRGDRQRRRLPDRLDPAGAAAARGGGERSPPGLGLGPRQGEGVGAQAGRAGTGCRLHRARARRCAARTCARRWSGRRRSIEPRRRPRARCHSFRP